MRGITPQEPTDFEAEVRSLNPGFEFSFDDTEWLRMQLSKMYLEEMSSLRPPNTTTGELETFIKDREWTSDHVWGWAKDEFLSKIRGLTDDSIKWRLLRDYIFYNMAWVTKLLFLPVEEGILK